MEKLIALVNALDKHPEELSSEVGTALVEAKQFLTASKTIEYTGKMRMPGVALKLIDLNVDLDDAIKAMANKKSDITFNGYVCLVMEQEPPAPTTKDAA